jgi:hypothetical protein
MSQMQAVFFTISLRLLAVKNLLFSLGIPSLFLDILLAVALLMPAESAICCNSVRLRPSILLLQLKIISTSKTNKQTLAIHPHESHNLEI